VVNRALTVREGRASEAAAGEDGFQAAAEGTVYLLHFDQPIGTASHYLGWAKDLEARVALHRAGKGGRATKALARRGGAFELALTWPGGLSLEAQLRRRGPKRLCPLCQTR
jgi:predicted GIY-YIG superfamily endonuclease